MKRAISFSMLGALSVILLVILTSPLSAQNAKAGLTNADVLKMASAKLGDGIIVAKIRSSGCGFDTGTDALITLKQAGVSDPVIQAMTECGSATPASGSPGANSAGPLPDPNDPNSIHEGGIYYVRQNPGGRQMTQLEPTVYSGGKTGGVFKTAMTYGIAKSKWKAIVRGNQAALRITEARPTFYFYFEERSGGLSYSGTMGGASSPNEFIMARMDSKKDEREIVMMEMNAFGASQGTRSKDTVTFDSEKIRPGVYKVQPRSDIEPGEYCVYYAGGTQAMGVQGGGKLFDFGINPVQ